MPRAGQTHRAHIQQQIRQQTIHQPNSLRNLLRVPLRRFMRVEVSLQQRRKELHAAQWIADLMRDPTDQLTHRGQPILSLQLLFELIDPGDVLKQNKLPGIITGLISKRDLTDGHHALSDALRAIRDGETSTR